MSKPTYKYYIRKLITGAPDEFYLVDPSGAVVSQISPIDLNFSPNGWEDSALEWTRGFEYWGVFTNMTNPLRFVKDGARILRHVYYKEGVNGNAELYIEKLNDTTQLYELYFNGEIDFSKFKDGLSYVTANVMDGSYMEQLKSREGTNYEIELDSDPNAFYIKMDGVKLVNTIEWLINPIYLDSPKETTSIAMTKVFEESQIGSRNWLNPQGTAYASSADLYNDYYSKHIVNQDQAMDISIEYDFYVTFYPKSGINYNAAGFSVVVAERDAGGAFVASHVIFLATNATTIINTPQLVQGTLNISNLGAGHSLHLLTNLSIGFPHGVEFSAGLYKINAEFRFKESFIKALHPQAVFNELVSEISDNTVNSNGTVLATNKAMAVTCGDALRSLAGAKIKTNFIDFFNTFKTQAHLATYYDKSSNTHIIKDRTDVFDSANVIYDIGEVSDFVAEPLNELLYSDIKAGSKDQNYDELNGRDEFNCEFEFTTPITRVTNTLDMITPYRTDMYGIEIIRANLAEKTTTDADSDNDNFLIYINTTPSGTHNGLDLYELDRSLSPSTTGVLFPDTAFNQYFSPKRVLTRNGNTLRAILHNLDGENITFQTASKNEDMASGGIVENADLPINSLLPAMFQPVLFTVKCLQPVNIKSLIDANPFGLISFKWQGKDFQGFLLESSETPATKASQTIKLISAPTNDLNKLIK